MSKESLEPEFGRYSEWMVEALLQMGDPIPGACRGTGNPELFRTMVERLGIGPGHRVLDVGCGLGGPAAWLAREAGCDVFGIDLMEAEIRGARRLFPEIAVAVATSCALPLASETFDGAWGLGSIEMIEDKESALIETARVLKLGAKFSIYGFIALEPITDQPAADHIVTLEELTRSVQDAGFTLVSSQQLDGHERGPKTWSDAVKEVRARIAERHSDDPCFIAEEQERLAFQDLWRSGKVEPWLLELAKER